MKKFSAPAALFVSLLGLAGCAPACRPVADSQPIAVPAPPAAAPAAAAPAAPAPSAPQPAPEPAYLHAGGGAFY